MTQKLLRAGLLAPLFTLIGLFAIGDLPEAHAQGNGELQESEIGELAQSSKRSRRKRTRRRRKKKRRRKVTRIRRTGPYLIFGVGGVVPTDEPRGYNSIDTGIGLTLGFGQRFTNEFSIEGNAMFSLHDAVEINDNTGRAGDPGTNTFAGGEVDLKVWFPIQLPRLEAYGLASIGYYSFDANRVEGNTFSGPGLGIGAGVDYRVSREFSFGARIQGIQLFVDEKIGGDIVETQIQALTFMPTAIIRL